jgi:hypothetical protein
VKRWRRLCWKIRIIQSDCRLLWRVWLKTLNLALVGGNPHYYYFFFVLFDLVCAICSVFMCFSGRVSAVQVWGNVLLRYA